MRDDTIVNPRTGQTMVFRQTAADTGGTLLQIECFHEPGGGREPVHTHPDQESRCEILEGRLGFLIDGRRVVAGPGEVVTVPAKVAHSFWVEGETRAHYIQEFRPALDSERFFRTLFALAAEGKLNEQGMPSPLALPRLVGAMGQAIRPVSPPWPILRIIAWVLAPAAWLRRT
ncbi:MAG: hypothetical protein KatS3mg062_0336 [Tepidiforma sp.]|nr:MAG: hypothetical protein KatS3mg062_0336 [Tepidiforma sp.]